MTSDTNARRPEPPPARPVGDSIQQPVKGAPVVEPRPDPVPPGHLDPPPPAAATATGETAYGDSAYREGAGEPVHQEPDYSTVRREPADPGPGYGGRTRPAYDDPDLVRRPAPPEPATRTATVSSPGRMGFGIGVLLLGLFLGISDQQATDTSMALRIPALITALIMVAQGIQLVIRGLPRETEVEVVEVVDDTDPARAHTSVRPRPWAAGMAAFRTDPGSMGLPALVIVLAIWLGLACLRVTDAPELFSNLSMLSAFVLFALGWTLIPPRR